MRHQGLLRSAGLEAQTFASAEEFLESGEPQRCGCLTADIRMPGMSGLDLQAALEADRIAIPIIFITAHGDERMRMQALRSGATLINTIKRLGIERPVSRRMDDGDAPAARRYDG